MAIQITSAAAQAVLQALADKSDVGVASTMVIYAAPTPARPDVVASAQVLATIVFGTTLWGTVVDGGGQADVPLATPLPATVQATFTGTADHFRILDAAGVAVIQGVVGADATFNTTSIQSSADVTLTAMTLSQPE